LDRSEILRADIRDIAESMTLFCLVCDLRNLVMSEGESLDGKNFLNICDTVLRLYLCYMESKSLTQLPSLM